MSMNVNQDYSQFYVGMEQLKGYGSNSAERKDTLVKYQFNTTDKHGNKVMTVYGCISQISHRGRTLRIRVLIGCI